MMTRLSLSTGALSFLLCFQEALPEKKTPSDFLVRGLEKIEPAFQSFAGRMYAGLIPINEDKRREDGNLMFWLYEPDTCTVPDSLVVWLNGGPGCSSFLGMFFENAPITVQHRPAGYFGTTEHDPLMPNPFSWTNATNMLYVEQPAGTGFSSGPEPQDEDDVSRDFYHFLQNLFDIFTDLREKRLFFFGESYAGMYVPSIAHEIHQQNKLGKCDTIKLAGIALGNGWIDATVQGPMVIDYAWWHGMIDTTTKKALHGHWKQCLKMVGMEPPFHQFTTPDECGVVGTVLKAAGAGAFPWGAPNTYDVTTWDTYPEVFSHNGTSMRFFNNPRVQDMLHAPRLIWLQCLPGEGRRRRRLKKGHIPKLGEKLMLDDDRPISMLPYLVELLDDAGIRVVVYNGDLDLSCCAQGTETLLDGMQWSGADDWHDPYKARRGLWMVDNYVAGYCRPLKNLDFVVVYNSGHLVPYNQPRNALDLVTRIVSGKGFVDEELPVFTAPDTFEESSLKWTSQHGDVRPGAVAFVAALGGFIAGATTVFCYSQVVRSKPYIRIGDVEVESQR